MDYEIKKVREQHVALNLPIRDTPPARFHHDESQQRRRSVRVATDTLIRQGIMRQDITEIAVGIAESVTAVAGACVQFGLTPGLPDALSAAKELIEDARVIADKSLSFSEADQMRIAACMMEIVCAGIAACFGIPYKRVFDMAHEKYMKGKTIDRDELRAMLAAAVNGGAANDPVTKQE